MEIFDPVALVTFLILCDPETKKYSNKYTNIQLAQSALRYIVTGFFVFEVSPGFVEDAFAGGA